MYEWELTDTFGGEPNYSWVRRGTFTLPANASTPALVRAAKKAAGLTGRHKTADYGNMVEVRPTGGHFILFVMAREDS